MTEIEGKFYKLKTNIPFATPETPDENGRPIPIWEHMHRFAKPSDFVSEEKQVKDHSDNDLGVFGTALFWFARESGDAIYFSFVPMPHRSSGMDAEEALARFEAEMGRVAKEGRYEWSSYDFNHLDKILRENT